MRKFKKICLNSLEIVIGIVAAVFVFDLLCIYIFDNEYHHEQELHSPGVIKARHKLTKGDKVIFDYAEVRRSISTFRQTSRFFPALQDHKTTAKAQLVLIGCSVVESAGLVDANALPVLLKEKISQHGLDYSIYTLTAPGESFISIMELLRTNDEVLSELDGDRPIVLVYVMPAYHYYRAGLTYHQIALIPHRQTAYYKMEEGEAVYKGDYDSNFPFKMGIARVVARMLPRFSKIAFPDWSLAPFSHDEYRSLLRRFSQAFRQKFPRSQVAVFLHPLDHRGIKLELASNADFDYVRTDLISEKDRWKYVIPVDGHPARESHEIFANHIADYLKGLPINR